jgi:hypothetical protein
VSNQAVHVSAGRALYVLSKSTGARLWQKVTDAPSPVGVMGQAVADGDRVLVGHGFPKSGRQLGDRSGRCRHRRAPGGGRRRTGRRTAGIHVADPEAGIRHRHSGGNLPDGHRPGPAGFGMERDDRRRRCPGGRAHPAATHPWPELRLPVWPRDSARAWWSTDERQRHPGLRGERGGGLPASCRDPQMPRLEHATGWDLVGVACAG